MLSEQEYSEHLDSMPISQIGTEILCNWPKISPHAYPYVEAMLSMRGYGVDQSYGWDSAEDVILRFLCNAQGFRGEVARDIKAALRRRLEGTAEPRWRGRID